MTTRSGKRLTRPASPEVLESTRTKPPSKRARRVKEKQSEPVDLDADDDFEVVLARIREQDASERLALQLQDEWDLGETSAMAGSSSTGPVPSSSKKGMATGEPNGLESDEAMARRLAQAWEKEDGVEVVSESSPGIGESSRTRMTTGTELPQSSSADRENSSNRSPEEEDLARYREIFTTTAGCSKCKKLLAPTRSPVFFFAGIPPPSLLQQLHAWCKTCKVNHCRGCGTAVPCARTCKGSKTGTCAAEKCCARVRAIAIFETLGAFDPLYFNDSTSGGPFKRSSTSRTQQKVQTVGPGGTGYSTGSHVQHMTMPSSGRGRGRRSAFYAPLPTSKPSRSLEAWDDTVIAAIRTLLEFLPNAYSETPSEYDLLPHPSIRSLVTLSHLPELLSNLLRNDSVMDWTSRSDVYNATLSLLRRLADSELTIELLIKPRLSKAKSCGLASWVWEEGEIEWEVSSSSEGSYEYSSPLYEHFKKLTKQSELFMTGASQLMEDSGDRQTADDQETIVKAMSLCGDILAARDDIERAINTLNSHFPNGEQGKQKNVDPSVSLERKYASECERLAFKHVTMSRPNPQGTGLIFERYNYADTLSQTSSSTRNPKNRLHLVKELVVMATCLPPGVWVRVDEVRNDAIKILIAGPENTPYEGGLFEFDCWIPLEYPHKPPLVHLRTTGGGTVRFNPNLYNNGKVCLSLLGTWPGRPEEQWSSKSTILQVLVSIQSMILIDAPYFNEPGYGQANLNNPRSKSYNQNIALQTTRWAIVDWMKDDHREGIWGEVIKSHFVTRKAAIRKRIHEWATQNAAFKHYTSRSADSSSTWGLQPVVLPLPLPLQAVPHSPSHHHPYPPGLSANGTSTSSPVPQASIPFPSPSYWTTPAATTSNPYLTEMNYYNGGVPIPEYASHASYIPASAQAGPPHRSKVLKAPATGMNLLQEFDRGVTLVEAWDIDE